MCFNSALVTYYAADLNPFIVDGYIALCIRTAPCTLHVTFHFCKVNKISHVMRKPAFCIHVIQRQRLCFCYIDSTKFKPLATFCGCTARFVSDLVGNPEDRFSRDVTQRTWYNKPESLPKLLM